MRPILVESMTIDQPTTTPVHSEKKSDMSAAVKNPVTEQERMAKPPIANQEERWSTHTDESFEIMKPPNLANRDAKARPNLPQASMVKQKNAGFCGFFNNILCAPKKKPEVKGEKDKLCPHCGENILVKRVLKKGATFAKGNRMMNHM